MSNAVDSSPCGFDSLRPPLGRSAFQVTSLGITLVGVFRFFTLSPRLITLPPDARSTSYSDFTDKFTYLIKLAHYLLPSSILTCLFTNYRFTSYSLVRFAD